MTISIQSSYCEYTGDGATTAFDVKSGADGIYFDSASELKVYITDADDVRTLQTITTHYTVTGAGSAAGVVTFVTAPATGYTIRIERHTPMTQSLALSNAGAFDPTAIMRSFDKLTRITQDRARDGSSAEAAVDSLRAWVESITEDSEIAEVIAEFMALYLGPSATDPTEGNEGEALEAGMFYWNTADNVMKFYSGTAWIADASFSAAVTSVNARTGTVTLARDDIPFTATSRILARKTAGAGGGEEATLSEVLDFIGSAARGDILYRGASAWRRLPAGTDGYRLTANGAGTDPTWEPPSEAGAIPSGTKMLFVQTAAPTGWTKITTHNDKALRVVSGTASSGGSTTFTTALVNTIASGSTTLNTTQIPAHTHTDATVAADGGGDSINAFDGSWNRTTTTSGSTGGGGSHSHNLQLNVAYVDVIIAERD